jgi:stage V sporulation protein G
MQDNAIEVNRIHKIEGDSKLKAFVDLSLGGVIIKGLRIVNGSSGLFVGMPRHQGKDGKWYNTVYAVDKEIQKQISELVLAAYEG